MNNSTLHTAYKYCIKCGHKIAPAKGYIKCQNCNFSHYINNFPSVSCIIFNEKDEILLGKRVMEPDIDFYDLIGGFTNPGETFEDTIIRELKEEVNIDVRKEDTNYLTSFYQNYYMQDLYYPVVATVFEVRPSSFKNMKGGDDIGELRFFKPNEIEIDKIAFDSQRKMFENYLKIFNS